MRFRAPVVLIVNLLLLAALAYSGAGTSSPAAGAVEREAEERTTRTLAFELAFGDETPYGKRFPRLSKLPYRARLAITREVLNRVIGIALGETDARRAALLYGPGGYLKNPVRPLMT
jgi:hypothetical protein